MTSETPSVSSRRLIVSVHRWSFYLLVPGRLHVLIQPWNIHVCRAR
jgi:hypothetical protein